jgi:hypothetical protein
MIILDFNAISIASIIVQKVSMDENLIRHMILNSIRMYRTKFKKEYGEIVLATDSRSWRKDYYPEYKANRKVSREKSDMDWNEAFRIITMIREEIKENFPYKVVHIEGCEADDIIGTLVENTHEFGNYENVLIVSGDKDFVQLQKYNNVRQYSPIRKGFIDEPNPKLYLMEHILKGDAGDGVPNVLSDDDVFVNEEKRQKPLSKKKMDTIIKDISDGELLYAASWYRNYSRNKKLIDLAETPEAIKTEIINNFTQQDSYHNKGKVFPYLIAKNCTQLIESVQEFI